MNYFLIKLSDR